MRASSICSDLGKSLGEPVSMAAPRVLAVIPGTGTGICLMAARRQVAALQALTVPVETSFFDTRLSPSVLFRSYRDLGQAIMRFRPDVVHVHYGTITGLICALLVNEPLVITFRGSDLNPEPGVGWLRTRLSVVCSQLAALRCRKLVCVSRQLASRLWWKSESVEIVPAGVDLETFRPIPRIEARRALGWDLEEPVLLFNAGHAPAVKGLELAEAVAARVSRSWRIRFEVMRGDVPPEQVPLRMNAADCLLVTSRSEGSPNVVKEAMACALPVVSVDVGDVRERLEGVLPSRIVGRDPEDIAESVLEILANPIRSNGRKFAAKLSHQSVAKQLLSVYEAVLSDKAELRKSCPDN